MKKLIAVLLVLLVASAFVFSETCLRCKTTYDPGKHNLGCPYCVGSNYAYTNTKDRCGNYSDNTYEAQCHDGYWDAKNKMSGSTSEATEAEE